MTKTCENCQLGRITEAMRKLNQKSIIRYCDKQANYVKIWQSCESFTQKIS